MDYLAIRNNLLDITQVFVEVTMVAHERFILLLSNVIQAADILEKLSLAHIMFDEFDFQVIPGGD